MPIVQAMVILALVLLACVILVGVFGGIFWAAACLSVATIVALMARWVPIGLRLHQPSVNWTHDGTITVRGSGTARISGKVGRAGLIVAGGLTPWGLSLAGQRIPTNGEHVIIFWAAVVSSGILVLGGAIALTIWAIDGARSLSLARLAIGRTRQVSELGNLLGTMARLEKHVGRVNYRFRNLAEELQAIVDDCTLSLLEGNWTGLTRSMAVLAGDAAQEESGVRLLVQAFGDLDQAWARAQESCARAGNFDLAERCRGLGDQRCVLHRLPVAARSLPAALEAVAATCHMLDMLAVQAERIYRHRRAESQREWQEAAGAQPVRPAEVVAALAELELPANADFDSARVAYLRLRGLHHPDRAGPHASADRFRKIQAAWECLQVFFG